MRRKGPGTSIERCGNNAEMKGVEERAVSRPISRKNTFSGTREQKKQFVEGLSILVSKHRNITSARHHRQPPPIAQDATNLDTVDVRRIVEPRWLGKAKVGHLHLVLVVNEKIATRKITVHNTLPSWWRNAKRGV